MRDGWLAAAVLMVAALAGCADDAPATAPASPVLGQEGSTGSLVGTVVDEAIRPLAGAAILVVPGNLNATTDADGGFRIDGLAPLTYTITASLAGYETVTLRGTVVAGSEPTALQVVLPVIPTEQKYADGFSFNGLFECSAWPTNGCQNINILTSAVICAYDGVPCPGNVTTDRSFFFVSPVGVPQWAQTELFWEATQPLGDRFWIAIGGCTIEELQSGFCPAVNVTSGASPLMIVAPRSGLEELDIGGTRSMLVQLSSETSSMVTVDGCVVSGHCGLGVHILQDFQSITHAFYGYQPPPGWKFSETGSVPPP